MLSCASHSTYVVERRSQLWDKNYFLRLAACVSADAATDFTLLGVLGLLRSLDALEATFGDVFSVFAMIFIPPVLE